MQRFIFLEISTRFSRQRRLVLAIVCAFLISQDLAAQYFQFSQYNFTSQRINPAMTGSTRYASIDLDSRTQRTGGDFNINSNFFSAAYPLLNPSTGTPWSGIGISVLDDHSSGIYKKQEASLSYAVHLRLDRFQQLSFGAKVLYQSAQVNPDGLATGEQYVPDLGFNPNLSSGETFQTTRAHYTTFSTGLYWQRADKSGNITGHWGISIFDINKPSYSFLGSPTPVPATLVIDGGFEAWHKSDNIVSPEILYTNSSGTNILNAGFRFRHELRSSPNQVPDKIDLITKYVVGRSGIIGVQLHRENLSFGVSYDFPFLKANPSNIGALEIGLTLRKLVITKSRKTARQRQLEKQKANAKAVPRKKATLKPPVKKDSTKVTPPVSEIQIVKTDSVKKEKPSNDVRTHVTAGSIGQDRMVVEKITLHFHFDYNSVDLDDETEDYLTDLGKTLQEDTTLNVKITGHTDNIGSEKFNQRLSQKRADAIRNYLIHEGVEKTRLESIGKGMTEPLNENDTEENLAKNRRVEIVVFKK